MTNYGFSRHIVRNWTDQLATLARLFTVLLVSDCPVNQVAKERLCWERPSAFPVTPTSPKIHFTQYDL